MIKNLFLIKLCLVSNSFVRNIFLVIFYATSFVIKQIKNHHYKLYIEKAFIIKNIRPTNSIHFINLAFGIFHIEKNISTFWTSISWSNVRKTRYICIPSWALTHIMTNTKHEPSATSFNARNHFISFQKPLNF